MLRSRASHERSCTLTDAISLFIESDDGITRFLIEVQSTGRRYDLIKSFFHRDEDAKDFGNKIARHR